MSETKVILVDERDTPIGTMEKLEAHKKGLLHRGFSIFIFNARGEMLIQKRALGKYHSGGLWSNACCSHPRPEEKLEEAVHRRLEEEMGFDCPLTEKFSFIYKVDFENGLTEHEFLHVFVGVADVTPSANPKEAEEWKYVDLKKLEKDIGKHSKKYTYWFRLALSKEMLEWADANA